MQSLGAYGSLKKRRVKILEALVKTTEKSKPGGPPRMRGGAGEDYYLDGGLYEWGNRSLRAVATGYPPVVALYGLLGASRPSTNDSRWQPFQHFHSVSGHTFIGAIPFLTAARMMEEPMHKVPFLLGSLLTGWSRIHDNRHYFSQVMLGWWIAYLSVSSVDQTQEEREHIDEAQGPEEGPSAA